MRRIFTKLLLLVTLQFGVLSGMRMTPEEIETLMELMNRTQIVQVVKKDDP
jgi:hypothetical protein